LEDQCVITRQVTVAGGVFAPGHLGELTQIVPFEMAGHALAATGTTQARIRVLPSRVVVCLLLAGCLFTELGYRQVWHKLTAGLGTLRVARPGDNALWQARARLGAAPLRWLFDLLRGPATAITAGSVRWHGLLVCAIDGTTMTIPDSSRNLAVYGRQACNNGGSGYPLLRLVALVACGTRTVIDAVIGPASRGELDYARRLVRSLRPGMLVLADRHFGAAALIGQLAATEAHLLVRLKANRKLPVLRPYRDGSWLSQIGAVPVRVAGCEITIATSAGPRTGAYRLATRDLLTQAANVIAGTVIDLTGAIGRRVLGNLLPDRRLRVSPRIVKRAISKYQARGPDINRRSYKATLSINILTASGP
jgi:hypothetical protein